MDNSRLDIEKPLVSVIVPSYNHKKFIKSSLESVFNQTYGNIELIVVDDGSTDGSVQYLEVLSKEYDFVLVIQENSGICKTLNKGITEYSSGLYIAILASDDIWHKNKIELQINKVTSNIHSEFSYGQALSFTDNISDSMGNPFPKRAFRGNILNKVFLRQHVPAGTILFSRNLFDSLEGFDEAFKEEDWDFVIRSASKTEFIFVDEPLLYYRSHDKNIMKTRPRSKIFNEKLKILKKNRHLVPDIVFFLSGTIHYINDILIHRILSLLGLQK